MQYTTNSITRHESWALVKYDGRLSTCSRRIMLCSPVIYLKNGHLNACPSLLYPIWLLLLLCFGLYSHPLSKHMQANNNWRPLRNRLLSFYGHSMGSIAPRNCRSKLRKPSPTCVDWCVHTSLYLGTEMNLLYRLLKDISVFIEKDASCAFLKLLFF